MSQPRDLSERQFRDRLKQYGMRTAGLGYYYVTQGTSVYAANGGDTRRAKLAYLISERKRAIAQEKSKPS